MKIFILTFFIAFSFSLQANPFSDTTQKAIDFEEKTMGFYAQKRLFTNRWTKGKKVELMYMKAITHHIRIMFGLGKAYIDPNTVAENVKKKEEKDKGEGTDKEPEEEATEEERVKPSEEEAGFTYADLFALYDSLDQEKEDAGLYDQQTQTDYKINETTGTVEHLGMMGESTVAVYTSNPLKEGECELIKRLLNDLCHHEDENIQCIENLTPRVCGGNL